MKRLSLIALLAVAGFANAATYELDPYHTNARLALTILAPQPMWRAFMSYPGLVQFDRAAGKGSIDISIPVSSLTASSSLFTQHLKGGLICSILSNTQPCVFVSTKFYFKDG